MWQLPADSVSPLKRLMDRVNAYRLERGLTNALNAKVATAMRSSERGRPSAALNQLGAFTNQVNAQRGKAPTYTQAHALVDMADTIIATIKNAQRGIANTRLRLNGAFTQPNETN
jgi:hypothetical protein